MKKSLIISLFIFCFINIAIPLQAATTSSAPAITEEFGAKDIEAQGNKIKDFIFHVLLRIVAGIAGGYGLIMAFFSGSPKPLLIFGGISLVCVMMPYFIEGIFKASSMLIP